MPKLGTILATMVITLCMVSGCVTSSEPKELPPLGPDRCAFLKNKIKWSPPITTLNLISQLFESECYEDTVTLGAKAREHYSDKKYSILKESLELFVAEGTVTDYVLESYERGYLSFLITMSLIKLQRTDQVTAELNRFYNEEVAATYNHGQDPVNALLQAALWDNHPREGYSSRPFWLWLSKAAQATTELRQFAQMRVKDIDRKAPIPTWNIAAVGRFPALDWMLKFTDSTNGFLLVKPVTPFMTTCADDQSIVVPTHSWFQKIAIRHSHSYHPLVNAKTWIRLPFGLVYGISTVVAGAGIIVSGCTADAGADFKGHLCYLSIRGGTAVMASSGEVVKGTLRPDLRHWEDLPAAIFISSDASKGSSTCRKATETLEVRPLLQSN